MATTNETSGVKGTDGTNGTTSRQHYADNPSLFPMEGGCACGQIRYRVNKAPLVVHCCHCVSCQRETGGAFVINAFVVSADLEKLPSAPPTAPATPDRPDEFLPLGPAPPGSTTGTVVEPRMVVLPSDTGKGQAVARCPTCGVAVWSHYSESGQFLTSLRAATLDRAFEVDPDIHIYVRSARSFMRIADGKPTFEGFYTDPKALYRPDSYERYQKAKAEAVGRKKEREEGRAAHDGKSEAGGSLESITSSLALS